MGAQLNSKTREALELADELDISIPEAAAIVGISRQTVYGHLKRYGLSIPLKQKRAGKRNIALARNTTEQG